MITNVLKMGLLKIQKATIAATVSNLVTAATETIIITEPTATEEISNSKYLKTILSC